MEEFRDGKYFLAFISWIQVNYILWLSYLIYNIQITFYLEKGFFFPVLKIRVNWI